MRILDKSFLKTSTPSVHAASIAFYKEHPVFSWFGGAREGAEDVCIFLRNLNNDGNTILIGEKDSIPRWNPILVPIKDKLILFEKSGIFCDRWQTFVHDVSNWSNDITKKEISETAHILPAGLNGPVKSCPLQIKDTLICGSSVETMYDWTSYIEEYSIDYYAPHRLKYNNRSNPLIVDGRKSYTDRRSGRTVQTLGIIQPTLWKTQGPIKGDEDYKGTTLHAFFRSSRGLGKIYYSRNYIDGNKLERGWQEVIPTNLANPNSAVDVVCHDGRIFLVHNPSNEDRYPLVLSEISLDYDVESVKCEVKEQVVITEHVDEKMSLISSELSYPYMIEHEGKLHIVYTYGRSRIEYVVVEI